MGGRAGAGIGDAKPGVVIGTAEPSDGDAGVSGGKGGVCAGLLPINRDGFLADEFDGAPAVGAFGGFWGGSELAVGALVRLDRHDWEFEPVPQAFGETHHYQFFVHLRS